MDSARYLSLFSRRMEKVLSRGFARVRVSLLALGILPRRFMADWWFDGDRFFAAFWQHFSGSSSELSPRVSAGVFGIN